MGADDDHVDVFGLRRFNDRLSGVTFPDQEARRHLLAPSALDQLCRSRFESAALLIDPAPEPTAGQLQRPEIDHTDREQARVQSGRQAECLVRRG